MASEDRAKSFGAWLRALRHDLQMSQDEAAERAGLTKQHISRIERGESGIRRETAYRIATALRVPADDVLTRAGFAADVEHDVADTASGASIDERMLRMAKIAAQEALRGAGIDPHADIPAEDLPPEFRSVNELHGRAIDRALQLTPSERTVYLSLLATSQEALIAAMEARLSQDDE